MSGSGVARGLGADVEGMAPPGMWAEVRAGGVAPGALSANGRRALVATAND